MNQKAGPKEGTQARTAKTGSKQEKGKPDAKASRKRGQLEVPVPFADDAADIRPARNFREFSRILPTCY